MYDYGQTERFVTEVRMLCLMSAEALVEISEQTTKQRLLMQSWQLSQDQIHLPVQLVKQV